MRLETSFILQLRSLKKGSATSESCYVGKEEESGCEGLEGSANSSSLGRLPDHHSLPPFPPWKLAQFTRAF